MNPANPGGKGLIYNDNAAEHEVTDRENNVEEELVKLYQDRGSRVYQTAQLEISTK